MDIEKITNIRGTNILEQMKDAIAATYKELNGLIDIQTCKIYSSYLYDELQKRHIPARIINTTYLGLSYEHAFVIVPNENKYYLIDLTFKQFNYKENDLSPLWELGFMEINNELLSKYLSVVSRINVDEYDIDNLFYNNR